MAVSFLSTRKKESISKLRCYFRSLDIVNHRGDKLVNYDFFKKQFSICLTSFINYLTTKILDLYTFLKQD